MSPCLGPLPLGRWASGLGFSTVAQVSALPFALVINLVELTSTHGALSNCQALSQVLGIQRQQDLPLPSSS